MEKDCLKIGDAGVLRVFPTDRFKTGTLSLLTVLPCDPLETPLTRLLLSVLCRGTEKYPTVADLNRRMDELYAAGLSVRSTRYGNCQIFGFRVDFLEKDYIPDGTDVLGGMLDILTQICFHPRTQNGLLLPSYVESEKQLQCDAIRSGRSNPQTYAVSRCRELLFGTDPYALSSLGREEQILTVSGEDLMREKYHLFGTPEHFSGVPLDFVYVGNTDPAEIAGQLLHRFGNYHAKPGNPIRTPIPHASGSVCSVTEEMPVAQGRLVIGIPTGVSITSPDFYAMLVANEILGVSPVSKLFMHVREEKSLCYHCGSSYDFYKGVIYITCGVKNENRDAAEHEIFRQIDLLAKGSFTDEEIFAAKKSLTHSYRQIPDHPGAMEGYYYGRALFGVNTSVEETVRHLTDVTRDEILAAAKKICPDTVFFLRGTRGDGEDGELDDE